MSTSEFVRNLPIGMTFMCRVWKSRDLRVEHLQFVHLGGLGESVTSTRALTPVAIPSLHGDWRVLLSGVRLAG